MVRGISKQVIVINGNNRDYFENACFILKEEYLNEGICEKDLLRQAKYALGDVEYNKKQILKWKRALWGFAGFVLGSGIGLAVVLL